jgi:hypothetical protein
VLQGVHAETIAFANFQRTRGCLLDGSRPLIAAAEEVVLSGTPPRRFRLRARDLRETGKAATWQLELHDATRQFAPLMRFEISFTPDADNTRVRLRGSTVRDLSPVSPPKEEMTRRLANEYARSLVEHIAHAIELRNGEVEVDGTRNSRATSVGKRRG